MINSEPEEVTSSNEEEREMDDGRIYQLDKTLSKLEQKSDSEEEYYLGLGLYNCQDCKTINMLTEEQTNTLISILDKIEESPFKD